MHNARQVHAYRELIRYIILIKRCLLFCSAMSAPRNIVICPAFDTAGANAAAAAAVSPVRVVWYRR